LAAGAEGVDAAGIFRSSLSDPDPAVRLWAVRTFAARKNLIDRQHLGEAALRDRSVQVRREAAPLLLDTLDADAAVAYLREMLLDENVGARWQARGLMTSRKALDFRVFYQDAVRRADRASRLRGALLGLGESGRREDVGMVMPFVERPPVRVQRAAIRALGSLAGAEHVQLFLQLLRSPLPGISKEARLVLQSNIEKVPANDLRQAITEETLASRSRCQALSLASHMGKWTAVLLLLEGHRTSDIDIQKRARLLLRSWRSSYNKSFAVPRLKEVEQLASVLADIAGRLHPDESRDLEHILQSAHRIADP
jgi:HEAT repeat protein